MEILELKVSGSGAWSQVKHCWLVPRRELQEVHIGVDLGQLEVHCQFWESGRCGSWGSWIRVVIRSSAIESLIRGSIWVGALGFTLGLFSFVGLGTFWRSSALSSGFGVLTIGASVDLVVVKELLSSFDRPSAPCSGSWGCAARRLARDCDMSMKRMG